MISGIISGKIEIYSRIPFVFQWILESPTAPRVPITADTRQLTIDLVKELCAGKLLIVATHSEDDAELLDAKILHL